MKARKEYRRNIIIVLLCLVFAGVFIYYLSSLNIAEKKQKEQEEKLQTNPPASMQDRKDALKNMFN